MSRTLDLVLFIMWVISRASVTFSSIHFPSINALRCSRIKPDGWIQAPIESLNRAPITVWTNRAHRDIDRPIVKEQPQSTHTYHKIRFTMITCIICTRASLGWVHPTRQPIVPQIWYEVYRKVGKISRTSLLSRNWGWDSQGARLLGPWWMVAARSCEERAKFPWLWIPKKKKKS